MLEALTSWVDRLLHRRMLRVTRDIRELQLRGVIASAVDLDIESGEFLVALDLVKKQYVANITSDDPLTVLEALNQYAKADEHVVEPTDVNVLKAIETANAKVEHILAEDRAHIELFHDLLTAARLGMHEYPLSLALARLIVVVYDLDVDPEELESISNQKLHEAVHEVLIG